MTDGPPKPERPDPFAPLPLANLAPVRRRSPLDVKQAEETEAPKEPPAPKEPRSRSPSQRPAIPDNASPTPAAPGAAEPSGAMSWIDMPAGSGSVAATTDSVSASPAPQVSGASTSDAADARVADAAADAPLLPSSYSKNDLRAAVGTTLIPQPGASTRSRPTDDDDDDGGDHGGRSTPRKRKMMLVGALTLAVGGAIAAMVVIGKINSQRYLITCQADRVVVQQGRTFPPWGESTLDGAEWKALTIPPEAPCSPYETENKTELAAHYVDVLKGQATTLLTAREVTKIDDAAAQLKQALLVARSMGREDERIDARDEIERLLGDVGYWRASAKLRTASEALTEAANEFEVAAKQRPRHVTDAAAWALYVRKLVEELRAGPSGAAQATFPPLLPGERPSAPPGVALPVEPGVGAGSAASELEPPPPADAGLPTGGVLL